MNANLKRGDRVLVHDVTGSGNHAWFGKILWFENGRNAGPGWRISFDNGRDGLYAEHEFTKLVTGPGPLPVNYEATYGNARIAKTNDVLPDGSNRWVVRSAA